MQAVPEKTPNNTKTHDRTSAYLGVSDHARTTVRTSIKIKQTDSETKYYITKQDRSRRKRNDAQ